MAPRRAGSEASTVPAVSAELSQNIAASQIVTNALATIIEWPTNQPVQSAKTAAASIAAVTTLMRPKRCALSLPDTETAMPIRPASVSNIVGAGSQDGEPACVAVMVRNVTAHARSAAISQV